MGVNMRILHCFGVKVDKLDSIPGDKRDEYYTNFCKLEFKDTKYETELPVIFSDLYAGGWEFFGVVLDSTHDFRYDGWATFEWKITKHKDKFIKEQCKNFGLPKPKHWIITYYS